MRRHGLLTFALVGLAWAGLHAPATSWAVPGGSCTRDADCDDGVFCNGVEDCREGRCMPSDGDPCRAGDRLRCDELSARCFFDCGRPPDGDGDGVASIECGGSDCDDTDPRRYPGNHEVCDADGHDEDCNPATVGDRDQDGDGFIDMLCTN